MPHARMLLLATFVMMTAVAVRALPQSPVKDVKQDTGKTPANDKKPEVKTTTKDVPTEKTPATAVPARPSLDKLKLPPGTIVIITDKLEEAIERYPKAILMSPEQYENLKQRLRVLEQQLKGDKSTTHSCSLTGKLEGDYVALRAEFTFATQQPKALVVLGLQGAHLVDEGDLDKSAPSLEYGDDGFVVRVEKEGPHQLALNLKVPVAIKRGAGLAAATERGFDLGLPGAPATTMTLELPSGIKDIRINDNLKKSKSPGRWELPLGLAKQVSVAWKEPVAAVSGGPLLTLETQVVVKLEATFAQIQAELLLEDLRGQTKEWRLLLPPGATPTVKSLPAGAFQWTYPDAKNPWHLLQLQEAARERITVAVQASMPRPLSRLPIGPFAVANAFRQQGTILIQASSDALRGQRLIFHPFGATTQRDLPKSAKGAEYIANFQYALMPMPGSAVGKAPLELEFKTSSGQVETQTDHSVSLKGEGPATYIETTTRIQAKAHAEITDDLTVQLPRPRPAAMEALRVLPALAFPAAVPWTCFLPGEGPWAWALPHEFRGEEEGSELPAADAQGKARFKWSRHGGKPAILTIHGKYAVLPGTRRVRVELPRPWGTLDRGGTLTLNSGPQVEWLVGPSGAEEPAPERHHWQRPLETTPAFVELVWRPHQPAFRIASTVDVTLYERSAHVRQHLHFTAPASKGGAAENLRLRVPSELKQVNLEAGGKLLGEPHADSGLVWLAPQTDTAGKVELIFEYDLPLPNGDQPMGHAAARLWDLPLIWPEAATRQQAKVRVWSTPGTLPALAVTARDWHERGIESVAGRDSLPALVVQGSGARLPLTLQMRGAENDSLASLLCDRTLMQVHVDDEGNQLYRARYLVRKLTARQLMLELPVPVRGNVQAIRFGPDKQEKALFWNDPVWNVAAITLPSELPNFQTHQVFLDVEYKLPASFAEGQRFGQTMLYPPRWQGHVLPGTVRWQVELPSDQVAAVIGSGVSLDYRWALQGWLFAPEASVTSADLEMWLTGREGSDAGPVGLAYWRPGYAPQRLVHFPRQWWLLLCSGGLLALGLGLYLLPMGRALAWLVVLAVCLGVVIAALVWPALVPPLFYGCEPGFAVLAMMLGLQWLLQERYRRQVVFMPGFARLQTGSSLTRTAPGQPREPSTVDAPAVPASVAAGGSHVRQVIP